MIGPPKLTAEQITPPPLGARLLDELDALFARFVAFPSDHARWATVLWVGHAHCLQAFESTPRLALLSPEKGSGKTRCLEVLHLVVPEPLHAINISAAALFRVVAERQATLLLDEADTYLGTMVAKQHEDLRGLINAGHRRGAEVLRGEVAGKTVKVIAFPAFAAAALAGIGDLPDTIIDRSVVIPMKRRAQHEHIESFRERLIRPEATRLRDRLQGWADQVVPAMTEAWPELPPGITDRAADVWEPLLAVGDAAGGPWPARAREAAVAITAARLTRDPSLGMLLLADCQRIFTEADTDRLTTEALIEKLCALDESPWGDLRGNPIDARGLARRLKKYEVRPGDHRFTDATKKGYLQADFHDAWSRYLPPAHVAHVAHVAHPQGQRGESSDVADVAFQQGYVLLTNTHTENGEVPPSNPMEGQQGQQGQHGRSDPLELF